MWSENHSTRFPETGIWGSIKSLTELISWLFELWWKISGISKTKRALRGVLPSFQENNKIVPWKRSMKLPYQSQSNCHNRSDVCFNAKWSDYFTQVYYLFHALACIEVGARHVISLRVTLHILKHLLCHILRHNLPTLPPHKHIRI
jgi:hypothetical protein